MVQKVHIDVKGQADTPTYRPHGIQVRSILWFLTFSGMAIDYMCRVNLNIAILKMAQSKPIALISDINTSLFENANNCLINCNVTVGSTTLENNSNCSGNCSALPLTSTSPLTTTTTAINSSLFENGHNCQKTCGTTVQSTIAAPPSTTASSLPITPPLTRELPTIDQELWKFSLERLLLNALNINYNDDGFEWNSEMQAHVIGSIYWLHWIGQIPSGILVRKYGTKIVFGLSNLIQILICFFIPILSYMDYRILIGARVLQGIVSGFLYPAMHNIIGKWILPNDRSKFISAYMGSSVGVAISYPIFGLMLSLLSWEWIFYVNGAIGIVWYACWQYFLYDTPALHPRIDRTEQMLIEQSLKMSGQTHNAGPPPWRHIFTSRGVLINIICMWGGLWSLFTFMTQAPAYFKFIHQTNMRLTGLLSGLPHILRAIFSYLFSMFADSLLRSKKMSRTNVRKLAVAISYFTQGLLSVGIAYAAHNAYLAFAFLTISVMMQGASSAGTLASLADLSPNFSGITLAICLVFGVPSGYLSAYIVGLLTKVPTLQSWQYIFFINASILSVCGILYVLFSVSELQSWNSPKRPTPPHTAEEMQHLRHTDMGAQHNDAGFT